MKLPVEESAVFGIAKLDAAVCLSAIGAQCEQTNLLGQLRTMEQEFRTLPMPVTFLRPGWFLENSLWDVAPARHSGVMPSFLQPLDHAAPEPAASPARGKIRLARTARVI